MINSVASPRWQKANCSLLVACLLASDIGCSKPPPVPPVSNASTSDQSSNEPSASSDAETNEGSHRSGGDGTASRLASSSQSSDRGSADAVQRVGDPAADGSGSGNASSSGRHTSSSGSTTELPLSESQAGEASADGGQSSHEAPSNSTGPPPSSAPRTPKKKKAVADAETTLKNVASLREKSRLAKERSDFAAAFQLTTQAWEAARVYPKDTRLRQITGELTTELDLLGKQANAALGNKAASSSTLLITK